MTVPENFPRQVDFDATQMDERAYLDANNDETRPVSTDAPDVRVPPAGQVPE